MEIAICRRMFRRQLASVGNCPSSFVTADQGIDHLTFLHGCLTNVDEHLALSAARFAFADR